MERYEYRLVDTPSKSAKYTGLSRTEDPFAHTLMDNMNELAREGWQFLRTETMIEDRRSIFGRASQQRHNYMVYRRPLRSNGMSLNDPIVPRRTTSNQAPNIGQLRDRISTATTDPSPVVSLRAGSA